MPRRSRILCTCLKLTARTAARVMLGVLLIAAALFTGGCNGDATLRATPPPSPLATETATAPARATATPSPTVTATPNASPTVAPRPLCAERTGGALITFDVCAVSFVVWSTADSFIDEAAALLASGEQRIPSFGILLDGMDCDPQWTWHPDSAAMQFADFTIELCDGCPFHIEADKAYWLGTVRQYCPWSARVIGVDDRR